jgi:hypothetical protein
MVQQMDKLKTIFGDLFARLMAFTMEQEFLQELGLSLELFYNLQPGEEYEFRPTEEFLFLTWFLLDDCNADNYCLMDEFLNRNADNLSLTETQVCQALKNTTLGLFQVKSIIKGASMVLRDVFTGDVFEVNESLEDEGIVEGSVLFSRVLRLGNERLLVGSGIFLDESVEEHLTQFITQQYQESCEEGYVLSFNDFLKQNGELINWWIRSYDKGELFEEEDEDATDDKPGDDGDGSDKP